MPRDNGLPAAASYAALVDVDPPVADHVLDLLRDVGIAGYAEPIAGIRGPYAEIRPTRKLTERIYVDRAALAHAQEHVGSRLPALQAGFLAAAAAHVDRDAIERLSQAKVENEFAKIAGALSDEGVGRDAPPVPNEPVVYAEDVDSYIPPTPPPLPQPDKVGRLAWAALIGGPLLVLFSAFFNITPSWLATLGVAGFIGGFVVLIARMPERGRDGDGWDDGAVV